jgi:hypothetical protein
MNKKNLFPNNKFDNVLERRVFMEGRVEKEDNPISRVKCVVSSCNYYHSGDHCMAEHIEIQPPDASNTETTDCATFIHK